MSLTPERAPLDFFLHVLVLAGCTTGFGYFAMKMDTDPVNAWVADENANEIIDPHLTEAVITQKYLKATNVGQNFRQVFDFLFYAGCALLIFQCLRVLGCTKRNEDEEMSGFRRFILLIYYMIVLVA